MFNLRDAHRIWAGSALLVVLLVLYSCGAEATADQAVVLEKREAPTAAPVLQESSSNFDYYVLALSWSPQHCATPAGRRDTMQCAGPRPYGFIVHGLWPQYERGWPADCDSPHRLEMDVTKSVMDIMPSERLIQHEWRKHGTCSGYPAKDYFALARKAYEAFKAPPAYGSPRSEVYVSPARYKKAVLEANPQLREKGVAVVCSGRFLQEVRVCLDKNLQPRDCGQGVRDTCSAKEIIVRPLR
jgi:ribonuclease T2